MSLVIIIIRAGLSSKEKTGDTDWVDISGYLQRLHQLVRFGNGKVIGLGCDTWSHTEPEFTGFESTRRSIVRNDACRMGVLSSWDLIASGTLGVEGYPPKKGILQAGKEREYDGNYQIGNAN